MKRIASLMLASTMMVAACQTVDPYTRETKISNTTKGAALGALGGAVLGALTNTSDGKQTARNAMIGAGIGALAGGAVGNYMDRQEARLRQRLDETGVSVTRVGDSIYLNMPSDVTFASGQANLNPAFDYVLQDVGLVLNEFDKTIINIDGHTDTTGSTAFNQQLSVNRADSVASFLIGEGVRPERMIVRGYGENSLKIQTGDGVNEPLNRRVEIHISPLT